MTSSDSLVESDARTYAVNVGETKSISESIPTPQREGISWHGDSTPEVIPPEIVPASTPHSFRARALSSEPVKASLKRIPTDEGLVQAVKEQSKKYEQMPVVDIPQQKNAVLMLQKHIRGCQTRARVRHRLEAVPHAMVIGLEKAEGIVKNLPPYDFMGILPDTYVVVSMMRQKKSKKPSGKNKNYCFSSSHSKVVVNSTCPIYNQDIKITAVASGTLVLSVMSQHTLGADTFLGQAELQIEDYHNLSNGDRHHFTLSLSELKIPVYDHFGNVKTLANRTDITGEISFTIDIPPILDNIAGWWFEVVTDLMGNVFDRRIWVVLRGNELLYYDSEFQGTLLGKVKHEIIDVSFHFPFLLIISVVIMKHTLIA